MEMFSKELYELDRNTVQYMIDEMQDTIDAQKDELSKQKDELNTQNQTIAKLQRENEKVYDQSISSTVSILRSLNIPEQEIITRICEQYEINEEQMRKCLSSIIC